jgi:hypothetical protein
MNSYRSTGNAERSRIEQGIREFERSLLKINQDRTRLAIQLAQCSLFRRLLASRQHVRKGSWIRARRQNQNARQRSRSL